MGAIQILCIPTYSKCKLHLRTYILFKDWSLASDQTNLGNDQGGGLEGEAKTSDIWVYDKTEFSPLIFTLTQPKCSAKKIRYDSSNNQRINTSYFRRIHLSHLSDRLLVNVWLV